MPTVAVLRAELAGLGLDTKGIKAVLEQRLFDHHAALQPASSSSSDAAPPLELSPTRDSAELSPTSSATGWSGIVQQALDESFGQEEPELSVQERGWNAQHTEAQANAAEDAVTAIVAFRAAMLRLHESWTWRVAKLLRVGVICMTVYQLTVCSTALVDGRIPTGQLVVSFDEAEWLPAAPALAFAVVASWRSSVLRAALPAAVSRWVEEIQQRKLDVWLAIALLLAAPVSGPVVRKPLGVAAVVLARAAFFHRFADSSAKLLVALLALGGTAQVLWCIVKGWRFQGWVPKPNRLEQHGEAWRSNVTAAVEDIALCRRTAADDALRLQSCAEGALERLGRRHHAVVDNTESLLCWGVLLSVCCYLLLGWLGTKIDQWKERQEGATHWAKLRERHHTAAFKTAFQTIDRNKDNSISREELRDAVLKVGLAGNATPNTARSLQEAQVDKLMRADTNEDGSINFKEFAANMRQRMRDGGGDWEKDLGLHSDDQVQTAFPRRCSNNSLSQMELQLEMARVYVEDIKDRRERAPRVYVEDLSDRQIADVARSMMASARSELSETGRLSYPEFKKAFLGEAELHPVQSKMLSNWDLEAVVRSMRAWTWEVGLLGTVMPVVWLPIPLLLPILFGPSLAWIGRLTSICRELQLDGTGVSCPFRFFEFSLAWPSLHPEAWFSPICGECAQLHLVTEHCSAVLRMLSHGLLFNVGAVRAPWIIEVGVRFPGVPLTSLAHSLVDEFSGEAKSIGLLAVIGAVPALLDYYSHYKEAAEQRMEEDQKKKKEANRNLMDLVQFSLCMLRRLPPDYPDPKLAGKQQFKYTTLFEVKLLDLVKDGENTATMIGEAADKCTEEFPFMHALDSEAWKHVRGMLLNELSSRFSVGYLAEEVLGSKAVEKEKFWFGFANEPRSADDRTSLKLRVIIASESLLKTAHQMNHGPVVTAPEFNTKYHKPRWAHTIRNMADLWYDRGTEDTPSQRWDPRNPPLRDIELCMKRSDGLPLPAATGSSVRFGEPFASQRSTSASGGSLLVRGQSQQRALAGLVDAIPAGDHVN